MINIKAIILETGRAFAAENTVDYSLQAEETATPVEMISVDSAGFAADVLFIYLTVNPLSLYGASLQAGV